MITAIGGFIGQQGLPKAPRAPSYAGAGHQALLAAFEEELRKQQSKSCERDVDRIKKAGVPDHLPGKREEEPGKLVP